MITKSIKIFTKKSKMAISRLEFPQCKKNKRVFRSNYPDEKNRDIYTSNNTKNSGSFAEIDSIDLEFLKEIEMLDLILEQNE